MADRGRYWTLEVQEGVAIATHADPPHNYICGAGADELIGLLDRLAQDDIRAVVLTGTGAGPFIEHWSVEEVVAGQRDVAAVLRDGPVRNVRMQRLTTRLNELAKPVIAALNGDTMGFGFELALAADVRIGQHGPFLYGLPEARLGMIPGGSGSQRLTRLLGPGRALNILLRGQVFPPPQALEVGLVHELADDARAAATVLAAEFARMPAAPLAMLKRSVYAGMDLPLSAAFVVEAGASFQAKLPADSVAAMSDYVALSYDERRRWLRDGIQAQR